MLVAVGSWFSDRLEAYYDYRLKLSLNKRKCQNCESLVELLHSERGERERLISNIINGQVINRTVEEVEEVTSEKEWNEIRKGMSGRAKRAQLTHEAFHKANKVNALKAEYDKVTAVANE